LALAGGLDFAEVSLGQVRGQLVAVAGGLMAHGKPPLHQGGGEVDLALVGFS
jgi:hypothetical protein